MSPVRPPDRPVCQIMLIIADPVFRSGLRIWLEAFPDFNVVAEAADGTIALQTLATLLTADTAPEAQTNPARARLDLVILDIEPGQDDRHPIQGFDLCRRIKAQYPSLSVLLLSAFPEPILLAAAQRVGANGYCARDLAADDLVAVIRQIATGQPYWMDIREQGAEGRGQRAEGRGQRVEGRGQRAEGRGPEQSKIQNPKSKIAIFPDPLRRRLDRLRRHLRLSGIQQIEATLADVTAQLRSLDLSDLDRAILAGRQRELRASRWIVNRLLATAGGEEAEGRGQKAEGRGQGAEGRRQRAEGRGQNTNLPPTPPLPHSPTSPSSLSPSVLSPSFGTLREQSSVLTSQPSSALIASARELQSLLFDAISVRLQTSLVNGTETALETDILREDKKRELFYLVLRKLEDLLDEVRFSQVVAEQVAAKRSLLLLDLWQAVVMDFFGKYVTIEVNGLEVEIVDELLQDMAIVRAAILDRIPGVVNLLNHLLFQAPLSIDGTAYPPGNPEALAGAEWLLENLMIQVANAVMQPLLNRFANVEAIKQSLYDRRLLSNREIERFRNDLSWRYRLEKYVREPTDIFESKHSLFVLSGRGIRKTSIYAARTEELQQLSGIPFVVTLALETRDAVAPRLRSVVAFVGNGLVYVLTEVIGRGIGLIGRGVIKGIGNVWQDSRFNRR